MDQLQELCDRIIGRDADICKIPSRLAQMDQYLTLIEQKLKDYQIVAAQLALDPKNQVLREWLNRLETDIGSLAQQAETFQIEASL